MRYKIDQVTDDSGSGWIHYSEGGKTLCFPYRSVIRGIGIDVSPPEEWATYCDKYSAEWAKSRREEILGRVSGRVRKWYGELDPVVIVKDHLIIVSYEKSWIVTWLRKKLP